MIAKLSKGDEILIKPGFGRPSSNKPRITTILCVDGYSAVCADGILLACDDGQGIELTGKKHEQFVISPLAQAILSEFEELRT